MQLLVGVLVVYQLLTVSVWAAKPTFTVIEQPDRLRLSLETQPVAEYVFRDKQILRPYLTQIRTPSGHPVTRSHPPVQGVDEVDHETMHPGLWIGFGDLNGHDFWRNQGRIEHQQFTIAPTVEAGVLIWSTQSRIVSPAGDEIGQWSNRFTCTTRPQGWRVSWDATLHSDTLTLAFGDQEEMGFGARMATGLTEKHGGLITNSAGLQTAKATWGQPAKWCDYSGRIANQPIGLTLMTTDGEARPSWWHNRDYGLFVANPFGRAALRQGERSVVTVPPGQPLTLRFAAVIHESTGYDPSAEYEAWSQALRR
ncbi:MAG: hypothetical protein DWH91_19495 [Planctomycetota bacterium]|nr:MAG: hypothetical protein DWH91_19495 [Planctomycetota bacterium]